MLRIFHNLEKLFFHRTRRGVYLTVRVRKTKPIPRKDYAEKKEDARRLIHAKLAELNRDYGFVYHRVAIRNQRSRWGSCSKKGNLNFNYRILNLPERLVDYIIVHELCHLKELNHSKAFWALVAKVIPDHATRRKQLTLITKNQRLS